VIAGLSGIVVSHERDAVIVDLHGFRLRVHASSRALATIGGPGEPVELLTHLIVREDAIALYGFTDPVDLELFQMLLGVSGVGPRVALNVLGFGEPAVVFGAIANGNAKLLAKIPGIGQRTAERIVLDLKNKLPKHLPVAASGAPTTPLDHDAVEALEALGYSAIEARSAVAAIEHRSGMTVEERVVAALQQLARG
jgi:holliday junction DNA helicase RuvA